jgi:DeoR family transcriptional regulator, suf operon transcriptional repressor
MSAPLATAQPHPALLALPETRRALLDALKRRGPLGAEALALAAGISASGVRQQLTTLERDGLVTASNERKNASTGANTGANTGRPEKIYRLTQAGDALYPRFYAELTNELLGYLDDDDPVLLERLFARRMQRRIEAARQRLAPLPDLRAKAYELARILDADGYLAECSETSDGWLISEKNCAILSIALRYGQACSSELGFLQAVLPEAQVTRVAHMVAGAHVCAYAVRALAEQDTSIT